MDINEEVKKQINLGFSAAEIKENLKSQNFEEADITAAMNRFKNKIVNPQAANSGGKSKMSVWSIIFIVLIIIRIIMRLAKD